MTLFTEILIGLVAAGLVLLLYARIAPSKPLPAPAPAREEPPVWTTSTGWTAQAGEEFAGLSEAARCDLIFAVADLQDERSRELLGHALDDPSEAVALAAAHALLRRGAGRVVSDYARAHEGARSRRLLDSLELLAGS